MRIEFTNPLTGMAYLPKANQPIVIDTEQLPPGEAEDLERLVTVTDFFNLPATGGAPPTRPDPLTYTVTVEDRGRSHTVRVVAPTENPALQELIRHLKARAAGARK